MKRLEHWKTLLKAAKAELPIRRRLFNAAERGLHKLEQRIARLEEKIGRYLEKT